MVLLSHIVTRNRSTKQPTFAYISIVSIITDNWMPIASFTLHCPDDVNDENIDTNNNHEYDDDDGFHEMCVFKMMRIIKRC